MTDTLPRSTSSEKFISDVTLHNSAAVAVTFIRTSEPFDAMKCLTELSMAKDFEYRQWSTIHGWRSFNTEDPTLSVNKQEEAYSIMDALSLLVPGNPEAEASDIKFPDKAYYTMMWPHPYLNNLPGAVVQLAELSLQLTFNRKRLFLVVPPGFECPPDIAQMIPIIDYKLPDQTELRVCYEQALADTHPSMLPFVKDFTDADVAAFCAAGAGLTRTEFINAVCIALVTAKRNASSDPEDFRATIMQTKVEAIKRSEVLEVMPPVSMEDVGGLDAFKAWMDERAGCVMSDEAEAFGVDKPKGTAVFGPPGTGKSLLAKAVASKLGLPLIKFDISAVFGSLVGESERRVREALQMLDAMAPCVPFLDEVDKAFDMNSGGGDSGTGKRVLGKVLTHMQESDQTLFWVLTANRVEGLPPELLRKGRLDELFSVTTPNADERRAIFGIHLRKRNQDISKIKNVKKIISKSEGYVGAEIEAAVKDAVLTAFNDGKRRVKSADITEALEVMKPMSVAFAREFEAMATWAEDNARPSSSGPKVATVRNRSRGATAGRRVVDDELAG